ncbi:MAG: FixH family protein [Nitrospirae bacterium]|nr:FixH family protein [Nitrospirota bacterium]
MKRLMALILAVMLMAGVAYAKGLEVKQKAGDYNVEIRLDKNPPVVGNNSMEIEITDASGRPVTDAKVLVNYSMPAMPGMPAANYKSVALLTGTKYAATLNPSMSGAWNVAVKITKSGKTSIVKFNIDAQ